MSSRGNQVPIGPPHADAVRPAWASPREFAASRGISVSKVLHWIATGELKAVNHGH